MDYKIGYYATSKAGHDKGKYYIISQVDEDYVYLVNGTTKKLNNPKKKKKMHIQLRCSIDTKIEQKLIDNCKMKDDDIFEALQRYR